MHVSEPKYAKQKVTGIMDKYTVTVGNLKKIYLFTYF